MTCELCAGTGRFPMMDQWKILRALKARKGTPSMLEVVTDAPCPRCSDGELWCYLADRLVNEGTPFGPIVSIGLLTMQGMTATAVLTPGDFPVVGTA